MSRSADHTHADDALGRGAYGAAEAGREYNSADVSERTLREVYFPPFRAARDAAVASFMTAFNTANGIPATVNPPPSARSATPIPSSSKNDQLALFSRDLRISSITDCTNSFAWASSCAIMRMSIAGTVGFRWLVQ